MFMRPLFVDEGTPWPPADLSTQRQARALREAIAPYLCLAELRRLATSGASILDALRSSRQVSFRALAGDTIDQVIATFLAVLELGDKG